MLLTATLHIALLSVPRVLCCDDLLRYSSHKERKALTQRPEQKSELTSSPPQINLKCYLFLKSLQLIFCTFVKGGGPVV